MTVNESIAWLKTLNEKLWTLTSGDRFGHQWLVPTDVRLTKKDMKLVVSVIKENQMICTPSGGPFGFGFALNVSLPPEPAPYPGTESAFEADFVITIANRHIEAHGDDFWADYIEPLVYTEENIKRVVDAGLERPREKVYYDY